MSHVNIPDRAIRLPDGYTIEALVTAHPFENWNRWKYLTKMWSGSLHLDYQVHRSNQYGYEASITYNNTITFPDALNGVIQGVSSPRNELDLPNHPFQIKFTQTVSAQVSGDFVSASLDVSMSFKAQGFVVNGGHVVGILPYSAGAGIEVRAEAVRGNNYVYPAFVATTPGRSQFDYEHVIGSDGAKIDFLTVDLTGYAHNEATISIDQIEMKPVEYWSYNGRYNTETGTLL